MNRIEMGAFDEAGTLIDYGCYSPVEAFRYILNSRGVPITEEEARKPMGKHKKIHIQEITEIPGVRERWIKTHGKHPTEEDIEEMFQDYIPAQLKCLPKYTCLIPGALETMEEIKRRDIKIGSTTGFTGEMMKFILEEIEEQGIIRDASVCATGHFAVRHGDHYEFGQAYVGNDNWSRPEPRMCNLNMALLGVTKPYLCVKVGDTKDDILEGKNAGMWTIGLALTGNEVGLNEKEIQELPPRELGPRLERAYSKLYNAGANTVVDSIRDVPDVIDRINYELARGITDPTAVMLL